MAYAHYIEKALQKILLFNTGYKINYKSKIGKDEKNERKRIRTRARTKERK